MLVTNTIDLILFSTSHFFPGAPVNDTRNMLWVARKRTDSYLLLLVQLVVRLGSLRCTIARFAPYWQPQRQLMACRPLVRQRGEIDGEAKQVGRDPHVRKIRP